MLKKISISFLLSFFYLFQSNAQPQKAELRAVWIATVANIDWPTPAVISSDMQKQSFTKLLDMHKANGMNAIIMQIRPAADAFYPSPFEPWSQWLTGKQGQPPFPYYDPLEFMIEETHKRGMEFHAWMNPYRAAFISSQNPQSATHITKMNPDWFITYGDKKYFDPGNKEAQSFVCNVVKDVVQRYNIDAIHFDDYFYPYKIPGKEFDDNKTYRKYGNGLSKDDWRRSNTDSIIVQLHRIIKATNPNCQFGISPFGIYRNIDKDPNGSNTVGATTNYDDLYADILLWMKKDWIDYVMPQLYWEIGHKIGDFNHLIEWWNKNTYGKNLYIGLGIYRAGSNSAWKDRNQIPNQIKKIRAMSNVQGMAFFSSKTFEKNLNGWSDSLRNNYFKVPAPLPKIK